VLPSDAFTWPVPPCGLPSVTRIARRNVDPLSLSAVICGGGFCFRHSDVSVAMEYRPVWQDGPNTVCKLQGVFVY
jgi:hypothetical protein